jgi:hypothetical protein
MRTISIIQIIILITLSILIFTDVSKIKNKKKKLINIFKYLYDKHRKKRN